MVLKIDIFKCMIMKNRILLLTIVLSLLSFKKIIFAQPSNDNCSTAQLIMANVDCNSTIGTTTDATDSGMNDACGGVGDDDVWYKFEVTHSSHYVFMDPTTEADPVMVIYEGTCANLDSLTCMNDYGLYGSEYVLIQGLTIGDMIFIRIFDATTTAVDMDFNLCVYNPPANDLCSGAIDIIPVVSQYECLSVNTQDATDQNIPTGDCGDLIAYDIWYKFEAISQRHIISMSTQSDAYNDGQCIVEIWDGCSGSELYCMAIEYDGGSNQMDLNNLIISQTYYIRIYGSESPNASYGTICVATPLPESEDDCLTAEILEVNGLYCSSSSYDNSLVGATETNVPVDTCIVGPYLDLWYKFEVINVTAIVKATINSSGNLAIAVFTGSSCSNLTHIQCVNNTGNGENEHLYLTDLTLGDTIYIRVYDADISNTPINFNICVYTPPSNDLCNNAIEIVTTNGANCSGAIIGNTTGATGNGGCNGGSADDDVWYWFTATDTLHQIQLSDVNIDAPVIEIFNLDCSGSQFGCIQRVYFVSSGFTIGQHYYIRIYSQANQNGHGSFNICITEPPINILCENAISVSVNQDTACTLIYTGNSVGQGYSYAKYVLEASATTQIIYIKPLSPMTSIGNDNQIFDDTCGLISYIAADYYNNIQRTYYKNFTIGNDYIFQVNKGYPVEGNYEVCITEAIDNDECEQAIPISQSSINTTCTCVSTVSGTCKGATPSITSGFYPNYHDVWFSFEAISSKMAFSLNPVNGSTTAVGQIFGPSCNGSSLGLTNFGEVTLSNLSAGQIYKIRVVAFDAGGNPGDFTICIKSFSNNFCSNPVILTPSVNAVCSNPVLGTTIGATASNVSQCSNTNVDVWFQFTATTTTHLVTVNPLNAGFYPRIDVYRKGTGTATCDVNCIHSSVSCFNSADTIDYLPNIVLLNSLTIGLTYLIEVGNRNTTSPSGDFNICVLSPGSGMNVWSTKVETYEVGSMAHAGQYEFAMKRIILNMTGTTGSKIISQIVVNTNGTTQTSDLLTAKLYYAGAVNPTSAQGSMPTFGSVRFAGEKDPILFGTAIMNPSGQLVFNGNQSIIGQTGEYARYLFLVYDVACNATIGNQINADAESITISSLVYTPYEGNNVANNIDPQNRYYTKADGLWSNATTWVCGVPPNGPDILPITLYHSVTVDDTRQSASINVSYLKWLGVNIGATLTLGQSSQGNQTGHSNKTLFARWGLMSIAGTLNVNGNMYVGEYSSNASNHFGQLSLDGTINIDGNDGTLEGSGFSAITIGTPQVSGAGFINILDPDYDNASVVEFNYNSGFNQNRSPNWTITFGGGDDNSIVNGFQADFIDNGNGSGFSTLRIKDVHIAGGLIAEKRQVEVYATLLPCQNLFIHEEAELVGTVAISGNMVNNGFYTGGLFSNSEGQIICATDFGWKNYFTNTLNQSISGTGFFRANAILPYPTSSNQNSIYGLSVQTTAIVTLQTTLQVTNNLMIKSGTIMTSDTSLLSLGTSSNAGQLCQTNSSFFNYSTTEYTGVFESWTGGGIQGPFKRYFQNNTTQQHKGLMPLRFGSSNRIIGFNLKNNAQPGSIVARFRKIDYGATCLPLVNEQGTNISNSSPSGYWKYKTDNLAGNYDVAINANGFVKRGGGAITNLGNIRAIISPNIPTFIHSNSTTASGPSQLAKVVLENIIFHQDTFVLAIGGGNNSAGPNLAPNNFIVTSLLDSGSGSFREAITLAMCNDTIRFDQLLNGDTILLTQTLPNISKNVVVYMSSGQNIVIAHDLEATLLDIPQHYVVELLNTSISGVNQSLPLIINHGQLILDNSTFRNIGTNSNAPVITNEDNGKIIIKNECTISNQ